MVCTADHTQNCAIYPYYDNEKESGLIICLHTLQINKLNNISHIYCVIFITVLQFLKVAL
jgi:hypothetical protein